jgi:hypothetical protein
MIHTEMSLGILPKLLIVVTLDDRAAHTVDPLHAKNRRPDHGASGSHHENSHARPVSCVLCERGASVRRRSAVATELCRRTEVRPGGTLCSSVPPAVS